MFWAKKLKFIWLLTLYEFKDGLNKYFQSIEPSTPVKDLEDLIVETFSDSTEMRYFDHSLLLLAQQMGNLESDDHKQALFEMLSLTEVNEWVWFGRRNCPFPCSNTEKLFYQWW